MDMAMLGVGVGFDTNPNENFSSQLGLAVFHDSNYLQSCKLSRFDTLVSTDTQRRNLTQISSEVFHVVSKTIFIEATANEVELGEKQEFDKFYICERRFYKLPQKQWHTVMQLCHTQNSTCNRS